MPRRPLLVVLVPVLAAAVAMAQPRPLATPSPSPSLSPMDPDGDDDPTDTGSGPFPAGGRFERVGRPPHGLRRVCDLTAFRDALYAAHANSPLGSDGATITRYQPGGPGSPFTVAFDWNRPGEPARGGGGGQGFLRVHALGGRLFVPDTDPPYNGLGLVDPGTEGYVFVSDPAGVFAPPRGPHLHPPGPPDAAGRAGAGVLPRAYHVLDAIRYRGRYYASTGSVPPRERAWYGPSPGALHVATPDLSRWTYTADYPYPWQPGVWRLTFLVRFRGRLFAGIQDYDGREPNDYVVFDPPAATSAPDPALTRADARPARVTARGGAITLRWYADAGRLWWIAVNRGEGVTLRVTDDGTSWHSLPLPPDAGRPTDITRFRGSLVVLAEHGLYRLEGERPVLVAAAPGAGDVHGVHGAGSPFTLDDIFCAAPIAVYRNALYAGGQHDGGIYRLAEDPAAHP